MPDVLTIAVQWAVPAAMGGAIGWTVKMVKDLRNKSAEEERKKDDKIDALCEGVRSLLRTELVRTHTKHVENDIPLTLADREHLERTYGAYHKLGGNGTGTELYNAVIAKFHGREI